MKKVLIAFMVMIFCGISSAAVKSAKIGVLAPIGQDEKDVLKWSENISEADGQSRMFRNRNTIVIYDDLNSMIMALKAGQIDRFAIGLHTAEYITVRDTSLKLINHNHNTILGFALAVREDEKDRLKAVNFAIREMNMDGTLERLIRENITELGESEPKAVELPKIDGAETLRVAITGDLPPMDCILADGTPAGFNTAFLAELSRRMNVNIKLVSVSAGARQSAIISGRVDAVFWMRNSYTSKRQLLPYALDKTAGLALSEPYLLEARAAVSMK